MSDTSKTQYFRLSGTSTTGEASGDTSVKTQNITALNKILSEQFNVTENLRDTLVHYTDNIKLGHYNLTMLAIATLICNGLIVKRLKLIPENFQSEIQHYKVQIISYASNVNNYLAELYSYILLLIETNSSLSGLKN